MHFIFGDPTSNQVCLPSDNRKFWWYFVVYSKLRTFRPLFFMRFISKPFLGINGMTAGDRLIGKSSILAVETKSYLLVWTFRFRYGRVDTRYVRWGTPHLTLCAAQHIPFLTTKVQQAAGKSMIFHYSEKTLYLWQVITSQRGRFFRSAKTSGIVMI